MVPAQIWMVFGNVRTWWLQSNVSQKLLQAFILQGPVLQIIQLSKSFRIVVIFAYQNGFVIITYRAHLLAYGKPRFGKFLEKLYQSMNSMVARKFSSVRGQPLEALTALPEVLKDFLTTLASYLADEKQ